MTVSLNRTLVRVAAGWITLTLACLLTLGVPDHARAADTVQPIRFARGASSAEVSGAVIRGERALYSVAARAGQHMSLRLSAVEDNAAVQIYEPGAKLERSKDGLEVAGKALPGAGEGDDATRWAGTLPETGTYLLVIGPTRGNATYHLTIAITSNHHGANQ